MQQAIIGADEISKWDQAFYTFLAEKQRRSGSIRTVQSYSRMLRHLFGVTNCTPDRLTARHAFAWAHGVGLSGKQPSSVTVAARLGCLSSFFRFLIRMELLAANPCDAVERPRAVPSQARGLAAPRHLALAGGPSQRTERVARSRHHPDAHLHGT